MMQTLQVLAASAALAFGALAAQTYPPSFPRPNATKILATDQIVVWKVVWPKGEPTALHRHPHDQVGTYYAPGGRVITGLDGTKREVTTAVGDLSNTKKGTTHIEEGSTDSPLRAVFLELLHDGPSGPLDTSSSVAPASPREGAEKRSDDERVTVWDYTWPAGTSTGPDAVPAQHRDRMARQRLRPSDAGRRQGDDARRGAGGDVLQRGGNRRADGHQIRRSPRDRLRAQVARGAERCGRDPRVPQRARSNGSIPDERSKEAPSAPTTAWERSSSLLSRMRKSGRRVPHAS